jgi:hypothetical protein
MPTPMPPLNHHDHKLHDRREHHERDRDAPRIGVANI